jgi:phage shock protein A
MKQLIENIMHSFKLVKSDILRLQDNYIELKNNEKKLAEKVARLEEKIKTLKNKKPATKTITKTVRTNNRAKKVFVASKTGKKFHMENCIFAQNIKPKTKKVFKSKVAALNEGYKACNCVK